MASSNPLELVIESISVSIMVNEQIVESRIFNDGVGVADYINSCEKWLDKVIMETKFKEHKPVKTVFGKKNEGTE